MKFHIVSPKKKSVATDAYVIACVVDKKGKLTSLQRLPKEVESLFKEVERLKDFSSKKGECVVMYHTIAEASRVVLLGLGEESKLDSEVIRESYSSLSSKLGKMGLSSCFVTPFVLETMPSLQVLMSMMEGFWYGSYQFSLYKKKPESALKEVLFACQDEKEFELAKKRVEVVTDSLYWVRNIVNQNAHEISPVAFADRVVKEATKEVVVKVYDEKWLAKEKMGLLLAVGQGSATPPRLVTISYTPNKHSKEHVVLVGKGITFDTGGLNLKPTGFIETMRDDMSGAASVAGVLFALAKLKVKKNVTAVIPLAENSIGASSYKPGDAYCARSQEMVEITNTDAEGRLILADAIDWAVSTLNPSCLVDVATLTGACSRALGPDFTGLFANVDELAKELEEAGKRVGELHWRWPLHQAYQELLTSDFADIKNASTQSYGGAITAALFLERFVKKVQWAHLDIAGTAFYTENRKYYGKGATGAPLRTLLEFLSPIYGKK